MVFLASAPLPGLVFLGLWLLLAMGAKGIDLRRTRRLDSVLLKHFAFYRALTDRRRRNFRERVRLFVDDKDFHGRGIAVNDEMKVLVAAAAVQLTFGMSPLTLVHFTRIIIYPDRYRSRISRSDHIGEVNPGMKAIVISWKHFQADYAVPDDARNLGLHEMAHALWFENRIQNAEYGFLDEGLLARWKELAQGEATRIQQGHSRLFRDYAATNQEEFFAVAVEYFFEQPREFLRELPDLYAVMSALLGQDPVRTEPGLSGVPD